MNASKLISDLEGVGVQLWVEADQLRFRAPRGVMDDQRRDLLREHKSAIVSHLRSSDLPPEITPDEARRYEPFPLTPVQGAYLMGRSEAFEYGGVASHMYLEVSYPELDSDRLETAWYALVRRHDALRTVIHADGYQRVLAQVPRYKIDVADVRGKSAEAAEAAIAATRDQLSHRSAPTDVWPLFAIRLTQADRAVLHLSIDLLIADSASIQLLLEELRTLYLSPEMPLPELAITPRDYILADRQSRETAQYRRDRAYWWDRIDELPPPPQLPQADDSGQRLEAKFQRLQATLSPSEWDALQKHARGRGVTASGAVLTAYAEVVGTWSRQRRFTLNLPVFNRTPLHKDVSGLVGDFTSVNLLAVDLDGGKTFAERTKSVSTTLFDDLDHRRCSGVEVLAELARRKGRAAATMPIVYTSIVGGQERSGWGGQIVYGVTQTPQVWLDCQVLEHRGGLLLAWDVRAGVFPPGLIEAAFSSFERLVKGLATSQEAWSANDAVTIPEEQMASRRRANDTAAPEPDLLLHESVLQQAARTPDAPAVLTAELKMTYRELVRHAAAVAEALAARGCTRGELVGVVMDKGPEQVVAVLGILMAGAAYLPIDTNQPPVRRGQILADARVKRVLTQSWLLEDRVAADSAEHLQWLAVDTLKIAGGESSVTPLSTPSSPDALAYVIYTSGSTGAPKGVMITHRGAVNTVLDINRRFEATSADRVLHLVNLGFDLSVYDVFGLLSAGGALVLPDPDRRGDPSHWAELAQTHGVTIWNSVPAQLQMLDDYLASSAAELPKLRLALASGDWIPVSLPDRIRSRVPGLKVVSLGGATEASIWSIFYPIEETNPLWRSVPYGKPLANQRFHVLSPSFADCPDWVPGELYIGGTGVAVGYLYDEKRSAERFIVHPRTGERLYRTGDLGRYLPDGNIEFLGREDFQVKIRGHRIELAEIEAALATHPGVAAAAVLADGERLDRRLVAFCEIAPRARERSQESEAPLTAAAAAGAASTASLNGREFAKLMLRADQVSLMEMIAHFRDAGLFTFGDTSHSEDEVADALQVAPVHRRLLRRWLKGLVAAGRLQHDDVSARYHGLGPIDRPHLEESWTKLYELEHQLGYGSKTLDFVRTSSKHLTELFRGELDVRKLLFPEHEVGSARVETAWAAYRDNLVSRALNQILIGGVRTMATARRMEANDGSRQERLRILEVGAGVGGTSTELIPELSKLGLGLDYLFSDISPFFLNEARDRFGAYPWVRYGLFDINAEAPEQGIAQNSVDVVICANVLHNARDIRVVLERLKSILAPGGWLVFIEPTRTHNYPLLISMEFFSELGGFTDLREGTDQTFFTREQWLEQLGTAGAGPIACLPGVDEPLGLAGQNVFFAQFKTDRERVTTEQLVEHLSTRLPEYMVPSHIQLVDSFPRSGNAKLDRAALAKWLPSALDRSSGKAGAVGQEPEDDLERRIAALWAELLGREWIGRDEDFYALGGDSLLVARLVGKLREREPEAAGLEWEVILRQMLRAPTVAGLAAYLRNAALGKSAVGADGRSGADVESPLVPLHGDGSDPVRVLVHAGTGTLLPYQALLTEMRQKGGPASIVGLEVTERARYIEIAPEALIKRLAADYARLLLERGHRSFHVVGYCLGGLIATEVSQALKEAGGDVKSLTIISSHRPPFRVDDEMMVEYTFSLSMGADPARLGFPDEPTAFANAIRSILEKTPDRMPAGAFESLTGEHASVGDKFRARAQRPQAERLAALHAALPSSVQASNDGAAAYNDGTSYTLEQIGRLYAVFRQSVFAVTRFQPEPYAGDITLMRHNGSYNLFPGMRADIARYWRDVCLGELKVVEIPGDHFTCLASARAPRIQSLLAEIQELAK